MYLIFGKDHCWYCKNSIMLLDKKNINYMFYDSDSEFYKQYIKDIPSDFYTVPRIIKETPKKRDFIGGYDSLVIHLKKTKKKTKKRITKLKKKTNKKKYTRK